MEFVLCPHRLCGPGACACVCGWGERGTCTSSHISITWQLGGTANPDHLNQSWSLQVVLIDVQVWEPLIKRTLSAHSLTT